MLGLSCNVGSTYIQFRFSSWNIMLQHSCLVYPIDLPLSPSRPCNSASFVATCQPLSKLLKCPTIKNVRSGIEEYFLKLMIEPKVILNGGKQLKCWLFSCMVAAACVGTLHQYSNITHIHQNGQVKIVLLFLWKVGILQFLSQQRLTISGAGMLGLGEHWSLT